MNDATLERRPLRNDSRLSGCSLFCLDGTIYGTTVLEDNRHSPRQPSW
jgi:hypothetical protein